MTTVRFSDDLWQTIANEAALSGVSASQYIRDAALARAATAAGARGDLVFQPLATALRNAADTGESLPPDDRRELQRALAVIWRVLAGVTRAESGALLAQSEQAQRHARRFQPAPGDEQAVDEGLGPDGGGPGADADTASGDEPDA